MTKYIDRMKKFLRIVSVCVLGFSLNAGARGHEPLRTAPDTYQNYKSAHLLDTLIVTALRTYLEKRPIDCVVDSRGMKEYSSVVERYRPLIDINLNCNKVRRMLSRGKAVLFINWTPLTDKCMVSVTLRIVRLKNRVINLAVSDGMLFLFENRDGEWCMAEMQEWGI